MAEERSEHRWSDVGELHDTSDSDFGQRIDVPSDRDEHSRYGDKQRSHTDGECGRGCAEHYEFESDNKLCRDVGDDSGGELWGDAGNKHRKVQRDHRDTDKLERDGHRRASTDRSDERKRSSDG